MEIEFDPTRMTRATSEDIFRIYRQLWGTRYIYKDVSMKNIIIELCGIYESGFTHEDALNYITDESKGEQLIQAIRHEATSTDGILRETKGNYTLRSVMK